MMVFEGKDSFRIFIEDNGFRIVDEIQLAKGAYKFAGDKLGLRLLISHLNDNELTLYEAENREGLKEVYHTKEEFNRSIYGEPETVIFIVIVDMDG